MSATHAGADACVESRAGCAGNTSTRPFGGDASEAVVALFDELETGAAPRSHTVLMVYAAALALRVFTLSKKSPSRPRL